MMSAMVTDKLPESVAEIAEVLGFDKALLFVASLPPSGSRPHRRCVYIPTQLPVDHWMVRMLGWHDAMRMQRAFGGMILHPSNARFWHRDIRNARIRKMREDGLSLAGIAGELGLSVHRVREILANDNH